jgi:NAD(P)H-hydrate epimerase
MNVLVTPDEMRAAEAAAVARGRSYDQLMRAAAAGVARWIGRHIAPARTTRTAIGLAGPGNNGGDTIVALALLIDQGWRCGVVMLNRAGFGDLPVSTALLDQLEIVDLPSLSSADVIIDGVYGIGGKASLPESVASAIRLARRQRIDQGTPLVAVDVPSGVDAASGAAAPDAFTADVTLCIGLPKLGLIREPAATHVGELRVIDIGVSAPDDNLRPRMITELDVRRLLPRRNASAHKHGVGTTLVVGGAPTYYGAPRLAAEAAARAGAGLVAVATPASIAPVIAAQMPEAVIVPLDDSGSVAATQTRRWLAGRGATPHATVVGPGLGRSSGATALLEALLGTRMTSGLGESLPVVLDADALNWIAERDEFPVGVTQGRGVMTPHVGELARLLRMPHDSVLEDPLRAANRAATIFKQVVVLKHGYSLIAAPDEATLVSPRSTPELATAGTGDVLAGLIGGMLAQGLNPRDAATVGLYIGAQAGLLARSELGETGVVARDVINRIPAMLRMCGAPSSVTWFVFDDREGM